MDELLRVGPTLSLLCAHRDDLISHLPVGKDEVNVTGMRILNAGGGGGGGGLLTPLRTQHILFIRARKTAMTTCGGDKSGGSGRRLEVKKNVGGGS